MNTVTVNVPINVETLIGQLTIQDKIKLAKKLEKETRSQRWNNFLSKIDKRAAKNPVSQKEINRAVKEIRKELYG